jgi:acyl-CoA dehydrogenase
MTLTRCGEGRGDLMTVTLAVIAAFAAAWTLAYHRAPAIVWTIVAALGLAALAWWADWTRVTAASVWTLFVLAALLVNPTPLRRMIVSAPLLKVFRRILPALSRTEREALEAGTVWWDAELFSGRPRWDTLLSTPPPALAPEERAFLDGPVETLCGMIDDWEVTHELRDLPPRAWQYIKDQGFLGIIIPREYGGLGYSALAHSAVITKLSTCSGTAAVSVMVPNSLGPAELLLHYGTAQQKDYYLPRLAKGIEMPCFALTSPEAGSDASSIPDFGIVCHGEWRGESSVLGIRLTWEKRYITLAPAATLLGLAFHLYDPERLIGSNVHVGITLALIPTNVPGVHIGRRHLPLEAAFLNGPTWGKSVFVPLDAIIGGVEYAGHGWRMLMNCLAAGRSISLPANAVGMAKLCARATGAYGRVRRQFGVSIGYFEGVQEALARIAGNLYIMDAARAATAQAVDAGEKPSVISAMVKYHLTERGRRVINDAMDVHGGKAICMGPSNYLAHAYEQTPIAITVEGANILTRSMIIFGQGVIRGHPYLFKEISAVHADDPAAGLRAFDAALCGHVGFAASNKARALWMGLTGARFVRAPGDANTRGYYRQLTRLSSAFAFATDVALVVLGGALKRRERLSARFADVLSELYLASCALKRYENDGRPAEDLPLLHWSMQDALARTERAFYGLFENLPGRFTPWLLRFVTFPWGRRFSAPRDRLGQAVCNLVLQPGPARDRLTAGMFVPQTEAHPLGVLEAALAAAIAAEPAERKLRAARRSESLGGPADAPDLATAVQQGVITPSEADAIERADSLRRKAIMVDDFPRDMGRSEIYQTSRAVTADELRVALRNAEPVAGDKAGITRDGGSAWRQPTNT